ncbi:MAG: hypothetical protein IT375_15515 [Polyangiaceae bacterium]|nr:hypothetical protein [Polyangiaceae bacterium]
MSAANTLVLVASMAVGVAVGGLWVRAVPDLGSGVSAGLLAGLGALMIGGSLSARLARA